MNIDGVAHIGRVAAGEHHAHRQAVAAERVEHERIAPTQTGLAERQPAQPLAPPRIGPGQVERDVIALAGERSGQRAVERGEVFGVARAGGEVEVQVRRVRQNG